MPYRELSAQPQAEADFAEFLDSLRLALTDGRRDPNEVVRDTLYGIFFGAGAHPASLDHLPPAGRAMLHSLDPRNVTTEPEYYTDIDVGAYTERKPFIWLWQMFDRSPLGQNALLGHQFRKMLAPLVFRRVGQNFKCWQFVEWSFGYNLSFGDNVVVHDMCCSMIGAALKSATTYRSQITQIFILTPTTLTRFRRFTTVLLASATMFASLITPLFWLEFRLGITRCSEVGRLLPRISNPIT